MKEGRQMIVYSGIKNDFLHAVEMDSIAQEIEETIYTKMHRKLLVMNSVHGRTL